MLQNGCRPAKVACNSRDGTSGFEFETLESCGFYASFDLCPQGIACERAARVCGEMGVSSAWVFVGPLGRIPIRLYERMGMRIRAFNGLEAVRGSCPNVHISMEGGAVMRLLPAC